MSRRVTALMKVGLNALRLTGADRALAPWSEGLGAIFMLHQVQPSSPDDFSPNRILRVTPEFLEGVIRHVISRGYESLSLDEVAARLANPTRERRFVSFTLDDGYRDNFSIAYPIFKKYGVPFAIYVPADYADGTGDLWWVVLEEALRRLPRATVTLGGAAQTFDLAASDDKWRAFEAIYWRLRAGDEAMAREIVGRLAIEAGIDSRAMTRDLIMNWDEIRALAADPLVTIGAHTRRHFALAKLATADMREEIAASVARVETELSRPCRHFSYPYGDEGSAGEREFAAAAELGLATAVTTRKGLVAVGSRSTALPRVTLNGDFQAQSYVGTLLTGTPFAIHRIATGGLVRARAAFAPAR
jgi:peptidoglycan/xylan/chitin deacetylase (PgdA/CDA1 family)